MTKSYLLLLLLVSSTIYGQSVSDLENKKIEYEQLKNKHETLSIQYKDSIERITARIQIAMIEEMTIVGGELQINEEYKLSKYANVRMQPDTESNGYYDANNKKVLITKVVSTEFAEIAYNNKIYYASISSVISNKKIQRALAYLRTQEENRKLKAEQRIDSTKRVENLKIQLRKDSLKYAEIIRLKEVQSRIDSVESIERAKNIQKEKEALARSITLSQKQQKENRRKIVERYGDYNGNRIANKMIWIGMTESMLLDSWGRPKDINTTTTGYGVKKQYVYGLGQYIYLEDGIVTTIQN